MAPLRSKQHKASDSSTGLEGARNPPPQTRTVATKTGSPTARTPNKNMSPTQKRRAITQAQKQALIDNLQLESTRPHFPRAVSAVYCCEFGGFELTLCGCTVSERARKLRAQYSLQAQGLRTRIEIRVNRIPVALRKANIGELLAKYSEEQQTSNTATKQVATTEVLPALKGATKGAESKNTLSSPRGTKRLRYGHLSD
jgi:Nbl1 / Borealin N terminal